MRDSVEAINDVPVVKTMIISAGFGAMSLAAAALGPLVRALGGAKQQRVSPFEPAGSQVSNSSESGPVELYVQLDAAQTQSFLEGQITQIQGRRDRSAVFGDA